ncbi:hypothetical protein CF026_07270 [Klebsiella michiganensis]|nr:hypothetical protein BWI76_20730 [Klebsiella sp. M5al]AWT21067.1 hypothetical protein DMP75_23705 [Klebsiella michiganensis]AYZ19377.1 hypothetical protein EGY08_23125 [Klebsiella sp. FDAARGOS_511]MBX4670889.1 hypothetical protein [Klebsiella sp. CVUAS 5466.2]MBX4739459.1 hypothetical protein [Klebsiella sp. CVUAS 10975.2]MBX4753348.1 hypothetical protein [Klebsiella sp. CVUAS 8534.2]MBX4777304.1 hypothetical protein [Klebsiella sp. CVUAS 10191.3]MCL3782988.1 hypothetical protein [Prolixi
MLIRPELQTSGNQCYIVSCFLIRPFKIRIVLLFISIHDKVILCHFLRLIAPDIGYRAQSRHNLCF